MKMKSGQFYSHFFQTVHCPCKFSVFIRKSKTAAFISTGSFSGTHGLQIKINTKSYSYIFLSTFFQPIELSFGIQIDNRTMFQSMEKGPLSFHRTIIYHMFKVMLACKVIFIFRNYLRIKAFLLHLFHYPR